MRKLICFMPFFATGLVAYSQNHRSSYIQKLLNYAQVTFPGAPKYFQKDGDLYVYKDTASNIYMAQDLKFDKNFGDYLNKHFTDSLYDGYIDGVTSSNHATLLYREPISVQTLNGVNFGCKLKIKGYQYWSYYHIFSVNNVVLSYSYWSKDSLARDDKKIQSYFNSFKLIINPNELKTSNSSDIAYKVGYVIGRIFSILVVLGVMGLIVFLIVRSINRKKKNPSEREYDGY